MLGQGVDSGRFSGSAMHEWSQTVEQKEPSPGLRDEAEGPRKVQHAAVD